MQWYSKHDWILETVMKTNITTIIDSPIWKRCTGIHQLINSSIHLCQITIHCSNYGWGLSVAISDIYSRQQSLKSVKERSNIKNWKALNSWQKLIISTAGKILRWPFSWPKGIQIKFGASASYPIRWTNVYNCSKIELTL